MILTIDIATTDVDLAVEFYQQLLGVEPIRQADAAICFDLADPAMCLVMRRCSPEKRPGCTRVYWIKCRSFLDTNRARLQREPWVNDVAPASGWRFTASGSLFVKDPACNHLLIDRRVSHAEAQVLAAEPPKDQIWNKKSLWSRRSENPTLPIS